MSVEIFWKIWLIEFYEQLDKLLDGTLNQEYIVLNLTQLMENLLKSHYTNHLESTEQNFLQFLQEKKRIENLALEKIQIHKKFGFCFHKFF